MSDSSYSQNADPQPRNTFFLEGIYLQPEKGLVSCVATDLWRASLGCPQNMATCLGLEFI